MATIPKCYKTQVRVDSLFIAWIQFCGIPTLPSVLLTYDVFAILNMHKYHIWYYFNFYKKNIMSQTGKKTDTKKVMM